MLDDGLSEVENPSELLMAQRQADVSGSCAVCVIEGSRPIIAEIQALTSPTVYPSPRRMSAGIDYNRLSLLLAVLEKRLGLKYSTQDVYLSVAGGLRLDEPSADMSSALALISTLRDLPVREDLIAFGEIVFPANAEPSPASISESAKADVSALKRSPFHIGR